MTKTMTTARLSVVEDGQALNLCGVSLIVDVIDVGAAVEYKVKARLCEDVQEIHETATFDRKGYNYHFKSFPIEKATHIELELINMDKVSVIYSSTLSALSKVPLCP